MFYNRNDCQAVGGRLKVGGVRRQLRAMLGVVRTATVVYMVAVPCYWEMPLQIARHLIITVGSRWRWIADGGAEMQFKCRSLGCWLAKISIKK